MSGIKRVVRKTLDRNEAQATLSAGLQTFFQRTLYPFYKRKQEERWISQNSTEGQTWTQLSLGYLNRKQKLLQKDQGKYPGGKKILVLTGTLFDSVVGRDKRFHRKLVTPNRFQIATAVPYAKYVNEKREFVGFGDKTNEEIRTMMSDYLLRKLKERMRAKL